MQDLVSKAMRLQKPKFVQVQLRPAVHDWLRSCSKDASCAVPVLFRGLIEYAYDKALSERSSVATEDEQ